MSKKGKPDAGFNTNNKDTERTKTDRWIVLIEEFLNNRKGAQLTQKKEQ